MRFLDVITLVQKKNTYPPPCKTKAGMFCDFSLGFHTIFKTTGARNHPPTVWK